MTTEKYINCFRCDKLTTDQIRGKIHDLRELPGDTEAHMKRDALEHLLREDFRKVTH